MTFLAENVDVLEDRILVLKVSEVFKNKLI